jgi:tetratricopeptide (TPR) repeat protein
MKVSQVIERAEQAQEAEAYDDARKLLAGALEQAPREVELLLAFAKANRFCERYGDAARAARKALELAPYRRDLVIELATNLRRDYYYFEALKLFEDLLEKDPDDTEGLRGKAFVLVDVAYPDKALPLFEKLRDLEPSDDEYVAGRALALLRMGRHREALAILTKILDGSPDFVRAHLWAAEACLRLHDYDGLAKHSARALELSPEVAIVHLWAARATDAHGDSESAEAHLVKAINIHDRAYEAYAELGILHWERGEEDDAFSLLRKAESLASWSGFVDGVFTDFLIETGRENGHVDLDALITKAREQPYSRLAYHLGLILRRDEDRTTDAVAMLKIARDANIDDVSVRRAYGETLLLAEDWRAAESELRSVLSLSPRDSQSWRGLAAALESQSKLEDAVSAYKHAIDADPANDLAEFGLGLLLLQTKRTSEAREHLQKAASLDPNNAEFAAALRDAT